MNFLQLKENALAHDRLHLKNPTTIIFNKDKYLACLKCYPTTAPSETFQLFWDWYKPQYQAQYYTGSTQQIFNILINKIRTLFISSNNLTDRKKRYQVTTAIVLSLSQSCQYHNFLKTLLFDVASIVIPYLLEKIAKDPLFKQPHSNPSSSTDNVASSGNNKASSQPSSSGQPKQEESLIDITFDSSEDNSTSEDNQTQLHITPPLSQFLLNQDSHISELQERSDLLLLVRELKEKLII